MAGYHRNNISFRISSADAISKFKSAQTHSFFQLVRKDIAFNEAAKEAVLLEFDRFSEWIFRTERICVTMNGGLSEESVNSFFSTILDEHRLIENVMERYADIFSPSVVKFTKLIHSYCVNMLKLKLDTLINIKVESAFVDIVNLIGDYLQHFLVCMHEYNSNVISKKEQPFLSIAKFCISNTDSSLNMQPCIKRSKFFQESGIGNTYILKNYSQQNIFEEAKSILQEHGITLLPEDEDKASA